jgi:hypothetical protein
MATHNRSADGTTSARRHTKPGPHQQRPAEVSQTGSPHDGAGSRRQAQATSHARMTACLTALAAELHQRGLTTALDAGRRLPRLNVTCPAPGAPAQQVIAWHRAGLGWWYVRPDTSPIAPASQPASAAGTIACAFTRPAPPARSQPPARSRG